MNGKIIKGIGGLYCVATPAGDIFAKPRGIFRKNSVKPMIGDNVVLSKDSEETSDYVISEILARKNSLVRPAVANVDCALFIIAAANPKPDLLLLDKLMAVSVSKGIKTMLVINKADRDGEAAEDIKNQYKNCVDCGVFAVSMTGENSAEDAETVKNALPEGVTVLSGQSGVGKSTLTNRLLSKQAMTTGEGADTLAAAISEDAGTIEDVYEPFLIKNGFINRTPRGRMVTDSCYRHFNIPVPDGE